MHRRVNCVKPCIYRERERARRKDRWEKVDFIKTYRKDPLSLSRTCLRIVVDSFSYLKTIFPMFLCQCNPILRLIQLQVRNGTQRSPVCNPATAVPIKYVHLKCLLSSQAPRLPDSMFRFVFPESILEKKVIW